MDNEDNDDFTVATVGKLHEPSAAGNNVDHPA